MDLVLRLREIRRLRGLSQKEVAQLSGVGEKTISSLETGARIGSLKISQLRKLLKVYGVNEAEFFGGKVERELAPWEVPPQELARQRLLERIASLPPGVQVTVLEKFSLVLDGVETASGPWAAGGARRQA